MQHHGGVFWGVLVKRWQLCWHAKYGGTRTHRFLVLHEHGRKGRGTGSAKRTVIYWVVSF